MAELHYSQIARNGLWSNNPGLVQLLGLCPLLAVSSSVVNGVGLGLATTLAVTCSNVTVSAARNLVRPEIRIPVFVLIIACIVTAIELAMNAWFHELYNVLGIFIPLIVTNCFVIGRAEAFASKNSVPRATVDGLTNGMGFTLVLMTLGALRELIGRGTLLAGADTMLGSWAHALTVTVVHDYHGMLLAILPPGAFFGLALLLALKNVIDRRLAERATRAIPSVEPSRAPA